ncbi:MAG: Cna B-type domain-containing protein [Blautia sp.]|nr:Cna B-type domain-containing protein [Blautia sp.]
MNRLEYLTRELLFLFSMRRKNRYLHRIAFFMAMMVVFVTTYALILPAISLELDVAEEMPGIGFLDEGEAEGYTGEILLDGSGEIYDPEAYIPVEEPLFGEEEYDGVYDEACNEGVYDGGYDEVYDEACNEVYDVVYDEAYDDLSEDAYSEEDERLEDNETEEMIVEQTEAQGDRRTEGEAEELLEEITEDSPAFSTGDFMLDVLSGDYSLHISYGKDAMIPEGAEFVVSTVDDLSYEEKALEAVSSYETLEDGEKLIAVGLFDLTIYYEEKVIIPNGPVTVGIEFKTEPSDERYHIVHFPGTGDQPDPEFGFSRGLYLQDSAEQLQEENGLTVEEDPFDRAGADGIPEADALVPDESTDISVDDGSVVFADIIPEAADLENGELTAAPEVLDTVLYGREAVFTTDSFSYFAIIGTVMGKKPHPSSHILTGAYGVKLSGDFPEGAYAVVTESDPVDIDGILPETAFAYDIKIYDSDDKEWQPAAGETVECFVPCEGTQEELEKYYWVVLHTSGGSTEQLYDAAPVDGGIRFTTGSFSIFTLRAQVTGTSAIGYSKVHFIDHQGNEIQGAVTGTIDYAYREAYDMWAYADQLDPSIAGDYEFSRVYLQLSGMQKDFRYIYLGTNSDAGQSGSSYKIYFFMNSIEESKAGGTYNGTWYTFSSGTKWSDDIYIVFNHVEDAVFRKVDDEGDPVSGAGFTLYTDSNCVNVFTYNDSAVTAVSDDNGDVSFGRIPYGTYYMKETTTPPGFKETGTVYTVNVDGNTSIDDIVNEEDDGSIIVKETKTVNITKEWSDGEDHSDDSVTITLFDQGEEAGSVTLNAGNNWNQSINDLDPTVSYMISETSAVSSGEDVTNGWIPAISSKTTSISTGYYQTDVFQQDEQYVIVYNGDTALTNSSNNLKTTSVTVQSNMLTSSVNNNMLWIVDKVSADGVISLKNAGNSRYLNLNNAGSSSRSWGLTTSAPQFVRYKPNNGTVQIYYRENMNEAAPYYLYNGTGCSSTSATDFTLYKKVNVRTENVTVTNKPAEYPVVIKKLEYSSDAAIPGTEFDLYTEEEYNNGNPGTPYYTGLTSGEDGYLTSDGTTQIKLLAGTYYLVETQAANGYADLSMPVKFTLSRGGRFTAKSADQEFADYTYASTVTDGGTSYPLLKVPNQKKVTLTFKAEEGVDKVQFESGEYLEISGDGTKELTVVISEVTGTPVIVSGIAEDGRVINGWTVNEETVKVTTSEELTTAIYDDTSANGKWTDRTYHVWSETAKVDIQATKVWMDAGTTEEHDEVTFTLYRKDSDGSKTRVGESKTISGSASGDALTVVWERQEQQYSYVLEEDPVYGYETSVTGDALNGFTVTNTPKQKTDLTIIKKVEGAEASRKKTYIITVTPDGFPGKAQVLELKPETGEDSKTIQLPYGTYTVEELESDASDASYTIDIEDYDRTTRIAIGSTNGEITTSRTVSLGEAAAVITVTNSYSRVRVPVSVWKTDFDKHTITGGASFVLYKADNYDDDARKPIDEGQIVAEGTTGNNGILSLGKLELGEYRLVETKAPDGYLKSENAVKVFVRTDDIFAMQETGSSDIDYKGDENWVTGQEENTAQIRIWNNPGVVLPSTGGPGTQLFTIPGSILLLGAGVLLRRRRKLI